MNWKRGLLLAGIHLALAGTLIVWQEAQEWPNMRAKSSLPGTTTLRLAAWQEEQTVTFNPCAMWGNPSPQQTIVQTAEFPATVLSGWQFDCPFPWSFAGMLHAGFGKNTRHTEVRIAAGLCALIPIQWFLVGGFPLIRPRRWWWEPGAFITLCTLTAFTLPLIPGIRELWRLPVLFAVLAWLWWFGLLVKKTIRSGWRLASQRLTPSPKPPLQPL